MNETTEKIITLYKEGKTRTEIIGLLKNIDLDKVSQALYRNNIEIWDKKKGHAKKNKKRFSSFSYSDIKESLMCQYNK